MQFETITVEGVQYARCLSCRRVGHVGWAHQCGVNWYPSVEKLKETLAASNQLVGTTVTTKKP